MANRDSVASSDEHSLKDVPLVDDGAKLANNRDNLRLEAKMTLLNGVTVIVGSIIGSGIFVSPTGVLKYTGSSNMSLIVWLSSGVFSMVGAYCYAELGCMISKTGADYAYIKETFGEFLAFVRLWVECMIVRPCSQAIVALTFSVYALKPFFEDCEPPDYLSRLLAAVCIMFLTFVNCWNVKWTTMVQDVFTFAKLFALFIIIIAGVVELFKGHVEHFSFENTTSDVTAIALSFYSGLFAYNGWNYLNFIIEELQDPIKNLPKAIAISCAVVTFVYFMTNVAFYTVLSGKEVLESEAVAVTFSNKVLGSISWIMPIFVALSTFGAVNGILLTSSRLFFAGAREGQMPEILTMIQLKRITPMPAVLCIAILSLLYLIVADIYALINYVGFATWLSIGVGVLCLPVLRYTQPNLPRPIKVNLVFPIVYIVASVLITIVPMIASPVETGYGCLMIGTSVPVYFILVAWKNKPAGFSRLIGDVTRTLQKMMNVAGSDNSDS
ncbi:Y+L amino acid transporter 2 [Planococcus citri]|uniref:Y+L amino acid transporter 2 n=1 Tax=Planococcus citri TaxID=170843 RepID=UPI0031F77BA0